jgi:hypothetical protein
MPEADAEGRRRIMNALTAIRLRAIPKALSGARTVGRETPGRRCGMKSRQVPVAVIATCFRDRVHGLVRARVKPRSRFRPNIFCKTCDQVFYVAPDPPKWYFVRRIGRQRG